MRRKLSISNTGRTHNLATRLKLREHALSRVETCSGPWKDTFIELALQKELTDRGIPFVTSKRILGYIVDIFIPSHNLVIEADGCWFHVCPECNLKKDPAAAEASRLYDEHRDTVMLQAGYDVFRFWEHEIKKSASDCVDRLCLAP